MVLDENMFLDDADIFFWVKGGGKKTPLLLERCFFAPKNIFV